MSTSFDSFADAWNSHVGDKGHFTHQHTILPAIRQLAGPIKGMYIYDVACGNGFLSRYLRKLGAVEVWASDISDRLIEIAKSKPRNGIKYLIQDASDFRRIPKNHFDLVVAAEAVPYISDINGLFNGVAQSLKPGGRFVFSCDHPLKDIASSELGKKNDANLAAKAYLKPELRRFTQMRWGMPEDKIRYQRYARPISFYLNLCGQNGLYVDAMVEPKTRTLYKGRRVKTAIPKYTIIRALKL